MLVHLFLCVCYRVGISVSASGFACVFVWHCVYKSLSVCVCLRLCDHGLAKNSWFDQFSVNSGLMANVKKAFTGEVY